ncbi:InsA N-terminal domain-containing protein [Gammaproteobacteria bacterium]
MYCPNCHSESVVKNGFNALGKQIHRCNECGRQFVLNPSKGPISDEKKELIDRLLLERIPLAGIARVVGVSESWLQNYVNEKYAQTPRRIIIKKKSKVKNHD